MNQAPGQAWRRRRATLSSLPSEILVRVARYLPNESVYRWMLASRRFHDALVDLLYFNDVNPATAKSDRSVVWACITGSAGTLQRAVRAGAAINECPNGYYPKSRTGRGSPSDACHELCGWEHAWRLLHFVFAGCYREPRWCPEPIIRRLLELGGRLDRTPGWGYCRPGTSFMTNFSALDEWEAVMCLEQVYDSCRSRRGQFDDDDHADCRVEQRPARHHRQCLHPGPCSLAVARLLLQHGADPNFCTPSGSLVAAAMRHPERAAELLTALAEAGADLSRARAMHVESRTTPRVGEIQPLHAALEDAIRLRSRRRQNWSIYPVRVPRAEEIVRLLLSRGVSIDERSRELLTRWEPGWPRLYRAAQSAVEDTAANMAGSPR